MEQAPLDYPHEPETKTMVVKNRRKGDVKTVVPSTPKPEEQGQINDRRDSNRTE